MTRFIIFYAIVTSILLVVDLYAFQAVKSAFTDFSNPTKKIIYYIYWGFTILTVATLSVALFIHFEKWPKVFRMYLFSTIMVVYLSKMVIIPLLLLEDVSRIVRWGGNMAFAGTTDSGGTQAISRSKFIGQLAILAGGVPLLLGLHGMIINAYKYKIRRLKIKLPHLPESFNGLKIIQISDIHSGSFTAKDPVRRGVELINNEEPDLVFFTGDMVNYRAEEFIDFVDVFNEIRAKEGIFSVFGNHDYADYVRFESKEARNKGWEKNRQLLKDLYEKIGWNLLLNENRMLERGNDKLAIIGSENWSAAGHFRVYGDMEKACTGCEEANVKLLLTHDPTHWEGEILKKYKDIDVTFSGHTHGAQLGVEIPGFLRWSPAQYMYKHWAGLYENDNQYLYVNRGFGFIGYHGRIGILPEITVMELEKG